MSRPPPLLLPALTTLAALAALAAAVALGSPQAAAALAGAALLLVLQHAAHRRWASAALQDADRRIAALDQQAEAGRAAQARAQQEARWAEDALRASEQRYALAVRGANDGLWEWDLAAERIGVSPRWSHMLGLDGGADSLSLADWRDRLHPDDRDAATHALQQHLDGATERYEHVHRLRHADGGYRWVLSRGAVLRRASGQPQRVLGLDTDITRLKRVEGIVQAIADGTAGASGAPFYEALVKHFARALHIDCAFITECSGRPPQRARTLAYWRDGGFGDNFEYDLAGTPCERVMREGRACFYPRGVGELFVCEAGEQGYLGLPIFARDGVVIGHLAFVHGRPLHEDVLLEPIYRIFTARAGLEIELGRALQRLDGARAALPAH